MLRKLKLFVGSSLFIGGLAFATTPRISKRSRHRQLTIRA